VGTLGGKFSSYSFAPDTPWAIVNPMRKGIVYYDDAHTTPSDLYYAVTTADEDKEMQYILDTMAINRESWGYGLTYGNCRTFSQDMFEYFTDQYPGYLLDRIQWPVKLTVPPSFNTIVNSPVINIH